MMVYTPIRHVERVVGRGLRGGRLMLGPFKWKREFPVLFGGCCLSLCLLMLELPIVNHMLNSGPSSGSKLAASVVVLLALAVLVGTIVWATRLHSAPNWPPRHVLARARFNQMWRRPVRAVGKIPVE